MVIRSSNGLKRGDTVYSQLVGKTRSSMRVDVKLKRLKRPKRKILFTVFTANFSYNEVIKVELFVPAKYKNCQQPF